MSKIKPLTKGEIDLLEYIDGVSRLRVSTDIDFICSTNDVEEYKYHCGWDTEQVIKSLKRRGYLVSHGSRRIYLTELGQKQILGIRVFHLYHRDGRRTDGLNNPCTKKAKCADCKRAAKIKADGYVSTETPMAPYFQKHLQLGARV